MSQRIIIDPVTRVGGHLRIECEIDNKQVKKTWASGRMWRGIETLLKGKDPRESWLFAQRVCGTCSTSHGIASVRAVENALQLAVPLNAQYIRNMLITAQAIQDHIRHFYQLSSFDWVDITSALSADPKAAARLALNLSDWERNSAAEFGRIQAKLRNIMEGGQPGIFRGGYWGHPAMALPPEINLIVISHYFQALEVQRAAGRIVSILGGKTPHIQNLAVGGVTSNLNFNQPTGLTMERLYAVKKEIDLLEPFIHQAYLPDASAIAAIYTDWLKVGKGVDRYLVVPELPLDEKGTAFDLKGGYFDPAFDKYPRALRSLDDAWLIKGIKESVKHSWFLGVHGDLPPYEGETIPRYRELDEEGGYSWVKAPRLYDQSVQTGPLADVFLMTSMGHATTRKITEELLETTSKLAREPVTLDSLRSTMGRHLARAIRTAVLHDSLKKQWHLLMESVESGDTHTFNAPSFPKGELQGVGFHQAPKGVLSHWLRIKNGKISRYQIVDPSAWNIGPRDSADAEGPCESSLRDTPVEDPDQPLEVLRTVHSFDPCLACGCT